MDGPPDRHLIFRRGGYFDDEEGLTEAFGEKLGRGECGGELREVIGVSNVRIRQNEAAGFQLGLKRPQEAGQAAVSDLLKDGGLGELIERAGFHTVCYRINRAKFRGLRNHRKTAGTNLRDGFDCPEFGHWSVRWPGGKLHPHGRPATTDGPILRGQWGQIGANSVSPYEAANNDTAEGE
jgi:hypothetical protein